jgi:hypothetical protein
MISDDFGESRTAFEMEKTGWYRLVLWSEDEIGNEISSVDWIAVYERKPEWASSNHPSEIAISVEKSSQYLCHSECMENRTECTQGIRIFKYAGKPADQ